MATEVASPNTAKIHLTERAAKQIRKLLEKEGVSPDAGGLRVGVQGGGCSGLSYAMRLDTQARDRDKIFEEFGARIFEIGRASCRKECRSRWSPYDEKEN